MAKKKDKKLKKKLKLLAAVAPPARKEPKRPPRPGYCGLGMTNTELGDRVEAALAEMPRWRALVGKKAKKARQGPFDTQAPDGMWCEVKAITVFASEYKVKPKAREVTRKAGEALKAGKRDGVVICVVEEDGTTHVYRRPGVGAYRLGPLGLGWLYEGKTAIDPE